MRAAASTCPPASFADELREQRWDDHRYYHQSRINQTLHFFSAICFLTAYALAWFRPAAAALLGWLGAMVLRQSGHFFFEPKGYDRVNDATHSHKEAIKVGYNLQRKVALHIVWGLSPLAVFSSPTLFGIFPPYVGVGGFLHHLAILWLAVGVGAIVLRTVYLAATRSVRTGVVWCTKIITDPFHDLMLYRSAPLHLLKGELLDPMTHVRSHS